VKQRQAQQDGYREANQEAQEQEDLISVGILVLKWNRLRIKHFSENVADTVSGGKLLQSRLHDKTLIRLRNSNFCHSNHQLQDENKEIE
jgi:hypothetical protein